MPKLVHSLTGGPDGVVITSSDWDAHYVLGNNGAPTGHVSGDVLGVNGVQHLRVDFDDPSGVNATLTQICR